MTTDDDIAARVQRLLDAERQTLLFGSGSISNEDFAWWQSVKGTDRCPDD